MNPLHHEAALSQYCLKRLQAMKLASGLTADVVVHDATMRFDLALKHLRNTQRNRTENDAELKGVAADLVTVCSAAMQTKSATVLAIPEGNWRKFSERFNKPVNSLFPNAHALVRYHGFEDASQYFPSVHRLQSMVNDAFAVLLTSKQGSFSSRQKRSRNPLRTLCYGIKGYSHDQQITDEMLRPTEVRISDEVFRHKYRKRTRYNFGDQRNRATSDAAAALKRWRESRRDEDLIELVQVLYDFELAWRRFNAEKVRARRRSLAKRLNASLHQAKVRNSKRNRAKDDQLEHLHALNVKDQVEADLKPDLEVRIAAVKQVYSNKSERKKAEKRIRAQHDADVRSTTRQRLKRQAELLLDKKPKVDLSFVRQAYRNRRRTLLKLHDSLVSTTTSRSYHALLE
jgi:hypothetical protein